MGICAGILKANCLHNGCFQKYRGIGRHTDWGSGGAPQHGPWASHFPCTFPLLDQSCWKRCEESCQTAFILTLDPTSSNSPVRQPTGLRSILNIAPSLLTLISLYDFPMLAHSFSYCFCQDYSSSSLTRFFSPILLSLNGLWDNCVVMFQWTSGKVKKVQKFLLIPDIDLHYYKGFVDVAFSSCCCASLGSNNAWCILRVIVINSFVQYLPQMLNCCSVEVAYLGNTWSVF